MQPLDGKVIARELRAAVIEQATAYRSQAITPTLAIIVATADPQADWYVRSLSSAAKKCSIEIRLISVGTEATTAAIATAIKRQAADDSVHGIILQTPLPADVAIDELLPLIPAAKDVDGASPISAGKLSFGLPAFAPATAEAVMHVLNYYDVALTGRQAVVVGRSRVVGKPVLQLLLQANATVTVCHSHTADLVAVTHSADILVVAVGHPHLIGPAAVQPGAIVIDVGTNVTDADTLEGDVDPAVATTARLTPVPGGVGPITTMLILQHTLIAVSSSLTLK